MLAPCVPQVSDWELVKIDLEKSHEARIQDPYKDTVLLAEFRV